MAVLYLLAGSKRRHEPAHQGRPRRRSRRTASTRSQDVLVTDGRIAKVGPRAQGARGARRSIDATGKVVCPGLHRHPRAPARAGLRVQGDDRHRHAGGGGGRLHGGRAAWPTRCPSTTTAPSPTTSWPRARVEGVVRVYPIGAVTREPQGHAARRDGRAGRGRLRRLLRRRPVRDERRAVPPRHGVRPALRRAHHQPRRGLRTSPTAGRCTRASSRRSSGSPASPRAAEDVMVARDIVLAELTGAHLHIAHISTAGAVRLRARGQGARRARDGGGDAAPPPADRRGGARLRPQHQDGAAAPDQARRRGRASRRSPTAPSTASPPTTRPHALSEKEGEFEEAANGVVGLETAVPLLLDRLVRAGRHRPRHAGHAPLRRRPRGS